LATDEEEENYAREPCNVNIFKTSKQAYAANALAMLTSEVFTLFPLQTCHVLSSFDYHLICFNIVFIEPPPFRYTDSQLVLVDFLLRLCIIRFKLIKKRE
jgi:hypothetical protein